MKTRLKNLFLLFVMLSIFPISKILSQNTQNNIASSADAICPIKIGAELPALMLSTSEGKTFNVNEAIQKKPAVLVIYRGGWCPYC
ncbi:MAG: redoxin domain-containing protein, partial [Ignavibacteriae bacterium]|nr:redoxin domain-containing protein [Ignavibacteriota bacterium]